MYTTGGIIRQRTLVEVAQWFLEAWTNLRPEIICPSFFKCSISNALYGTEDDILWKEEEEKCDDDAMYHDGPDTLEGEQLLATIDDTDS